MNIRKTIENGFVAFASVAIIFGCAAKAVCANEVFTKNSCVAGAQYAADESFELSVGVARNFVRIQMDGSDSSAATQQCMIYQDKKAIHNDFGVLKGFIMMPPDLASDEEETVVYYGSYNGKTLYVQLNGGRDLAQVQYSSRHEKKAAECEIDTIYIGGELDIKLKKCVALKPPFDQSNIKALVDAGKRVCREVVKEKFLQEKKGFFGPKEETEALTSSYVKNIEENIKAVLNAKAGPIRSVRRVKPVFEGKRIAL